MLNFLFGSISKYKSVKRIKIWYMNIYWYSFHFRHSKAPNAFCSKSFQPLDSKSTRFPLNVRVRVDVMMWWTMIVSRGFYITDDGDRAISSLCGALLIPIPTPQPHRPPTLLCTCPARHPLCTFLSPWCVRSAIRAIQWRVCVSAAAFKYAAGMCVCVCSVHGVWAIMR